MLTGIQNMITGIQYMITGIQNMITGIHYMITGIRTVTKEQHDEVIERLHDSVKCKRPDFWKTKSCMLHQDKELAHGSLPGFKISYFRLRLIPLMSLHAILSGDEEFA
ncbi:hypothetical protein AVEN_129466-1 [Araneus ventricosus]|uniref:Uncharacterized protein n=1 Tax=Araneus ventricosus TaxID=182803 RepID=A0A4Y2M7C7_ARAVE|nr:hypothetical protein AVEN_129466-1 [Araneus ventricosus]